MIKAKKINKKKKKKKKKKEQKRNNWLVRSKSGSVKFSKYFAKWDIQ